MTTQTDYIAFNGGLNQTASLIGVPPGYVIDGTNFECDINGGYRRIGGYERFDGRTQPHLANYYSATATFVGSVAVDDTLTGATSGATATVVGFSLTQIFIAKVTGIFQDGENVHVGGPTVATLTSLFALNGAPMNELDAQYRAAAMDVYRAFITEVPGSGPIRGVWIYQNPTTGEAEQYAFRNNAGATACVMHKATSSGWSAVTFDYEISFTGGSGTTLVDGVAIANGAGATATVKRVVLQSGTFAGSNAAGRLIVSGIGGTWANGNNIQVSGVTRATAASGTTQITLQPGGAFRFVNYAFGSTLKMYGVDGVSRGFEYGPNTAGTMVFVPITTGMSPDTPNYICAHKSHLFVSFGPSLQHSGIGSPYQWTVVTGAAEISAGYDVTGLLSQTGEKDSGSLMIFTRQTISVLYGNSSADWSKVILADGMGGIARSAQSIGAAYALDDRGILQVGATQNWGNFEQSTISKLYKDWIQIKKSRLVDSCVNREKNQYRLFFSDGSGLYLTLEGAKVVGAIPQSFSHTPACVCESELADGSEMTLMGSTDGYVYLMDVGPSFDGADINAYINMPFNSLKSPRLRKRFRKVVLDGRFENYCELLYGYQLGYGKSEIMQPQNENIDVSDGVSTWDASFWDSMIWDGGFTPSEISLVGTAENIQFVFQNNTNYVLPFTLSGVILHYSIRRQLR